MKRLFIFLLFFLPLVYANYGQSVIWSEDFNSDGGVGCNGGSGCSSPTSGKWTTYLNGANLSNGDWLKVVNNKLEWKDTDGEAIWQSELVTITNYENVSVSVDWEEAYNGSSDYLRFYFKIDGGSELEFTNNGLVNGSTISGDNNNSSSSVSSLSGNTIQIIVKGRNSSNSDQWRIDNVIIEGTLPVCSDPTDQPSELIISNTTENSFEINWTNTTSSDVIVTIKEQSYPISLPSDDVFYSGNTIFGNGDEIGNSNFVIYSGSITGSSPIEITGLNPNTTYNISIYSANSSCYNTSSALSKTNTTTTNLCTNPTSQISSLTISNNTSTGTDLSWVNGNGSATIIVAAESNSTIYPPVQGVSYQSNSYYGDGNQTGYNNYVVYNGTANSVNITGLSPNNTYNFYGYTFNSSTNCYNQSPIFASTTTGNDLILTNGTFSACGGKLFDDGGSSGNHSNGATIQMTLESQNNEEAVCVDFTSWSVTGRVKFYDGPSVGSQIIYDVTSDWNQTNSSAPMFEGPGMVCASNGPLTIEFDPSGTNDGFIGDIICYTPSSNTVDSCNIIATANNTSICEGESIQLSAVGEITTTPLSNNFNTSSIGSEWDISVDARFDNPCGGYNGTPALWMGVVPAPRALTTNDYDLSNGGSISFAFMQADDDGTAPCEGPDRQQEGIFFQYSIDGGNQWTTMSPFYEGWTTYGSAQWNVLNWINYHYTIPIAARTSSTRFRWYQAVITSNTTDHWGLDEIIISSTSSTSITWKDLSTGQVIAASANSTNLDVTISPTTTTTYRAEITDGTNTCYEDVTINVNNFTYAVTEPSSCGADNGEIEIFVTGIGPFEYSIDDGVSFQSSSIFSGLSAGNYQILVSDLGPNNCQITKSVTLGNSPHIIAASNKTICEGESVELNIDSAYGGLLVEEFEMTFNSPYSYTTSNINNSGLYYVIISDTFSIIDNEIRDAFFESGSYNNNTWSANSIWEIDNSDPSNISQIPLSLNSDHIYQLIIEGGNNHIFSFNDSTYSDNLGSLNFKIYFLGDILWPDGSSSLTNIVSPTTDSIFYVTIDNGTCNSQDSMNITVNPAHQTIDVITTCNNYTWIDGINYTENNNSATFNYQSIYGCDSTILLNLTISDINVFTERESCDSLEWNGSTYYTSGEYNQTLQTISGCDSIVTLDLTINESTTGDTSGIYCDEMTWYGTIYSSSGLYNYTLPNSKGCDSIVTLDLTINLNTSGDTIATACDNFSWNGNSYNSSGQYDFTLLNSNGCDSVVTLDLTIKNSSNKDTSIIACDNFSWNGNNYTSSGNYNQTFTNIEGCDSIVILDLTVNNSSSSIDSHSSCDSFIWMDGIEYTSSNNTALFTIENHLGCDSVISLDLTINNSEISDTSAVTCDSIYWNGNYYDSSGIYNYNLQGLNGCDSTIRLNLTINASTASFEQASSCNSYGWNGVTYFESGTYTFESTNAAGCSDVETLNLAISVSNETFEQASSCDSYDWNGLTYSESGTYIDTLQTITGCDSIINLELTINQSSGSDTSAISCDMFVWYSDTLTSAGTYYKTLESSLGCDSTISLNLVINENSYSDTSIIECDSILWNGTTLNTSGIYEHALPNSIGCDSVISLNLTIYNSTYNIDNQIACDSLLWTDGNTYYENNNSASLYLQSINGCDSVINLNLSIYSSSEISTDIISGCDSINWIDGNTYYENNNTAQYNLSNSNGCDSVVSLNLDISYSFFNINSNGTCSDGYPFEWDGLTFNSEGLQVKYLNTVNNCDSIIYYELATYDDPNVNININDTTICEDSSILLYGVGAETYNWSNGIINNTLYFPIESGNISVVGIDSNNCISSSSIYIGIDSCYYDDFILNTPNIFTPDNNGINDLYYVSGTNFIFKKLTIFNRWGEQIFNTTQQKSWDGRLNSGQKAPEGTYFLILDITKYKDNIPSDTIIKKTLHLNR